VVFEGGHGSGKTTQAKLLINSLHRAGHKCVYTQEPFSAILKPAIAFYSKKDTAHPIVLALLVAADRYAHLEQIVDFLRRGFVVVCDRYYPSSWVYQTIHGVPLRFIHFINQHAPQPDLLFIIETPLRTRLRRSVGRRKSSHNHIFLTPKLLREEQRLYSVVTGQLRHQPFVRVLNGQKKRKELSDEVSSITTSLLDSRRIRRR